MPDCPKCHADAYYVSEWLGQHECAVCCHTWLTELRSGAGKPQADKPKTSDFLRIPGAEIGNLKK